MYHKGTRARTQHVENARFKHVLNILNVEYGRLGVTDVGTIAASLFDIGNPEVDWVALAKGFGVPGGKAETAEELCALLEQSYSTPGPFLIQASGEIKR